ncbi:MAG: TonB family protein [Pseudomonadota bacterium]
MVRICALVLVAVLALGGGCKSVPKKSPTRTTYTSEGDVSAQRVQAQRQAQYQSDSGSTYTGSHPAKDNAVPQYPAGLLSSRLPSVSVTVHVVVDDAGMVSDATVAGGESLQPEFADAVLSAVRSWRFDPLRRITEGKVEALPFSDQFQFVFTQVNGRAVVKPATPASR